MEEVTVLRGVGAWRAALLLSLCWPSLARGQPVLAHVGLDCVAPGRFTVVLSNIDPSNEIHTARVFFRSSLYPDFYYVEMKREEERFVAVLPQPQGSTPQVVYYVEAVDSSYRTLRSPQFEPAVTDPCDSDPAATYAGGDPEIVVGATNPGAAAIPPGFAAAGIVGLGGVGAGVVVAAAVGAAGAAGTIVVVANGGATTTAIPGAPPSLTTTTAGDGTGTSSSTTTTAPGDPATSTTSTSTTTAPTTTTTAAPLNPQCFSVSSPAACRVRLDATCVHLPVDDYDWVLDTANRWQRVDFPGSPTAFTHNWMPGVCGADAVLTFRLTVRRAGQSVTAAKSLFVSGKELREPVPARGRLVLRTHLDLPPGDGSARGRIAYDGTMWRVVDGSQPVAIERDASRGTRTLEAVVGRGGAGPGTWRFDLAASEGVVPGSLRVVAGTALSVEPLAVVFRLSGEPLERVAFQLEVSP